MAYDKLIDSTQLDGALTATANAIREKGGTTAVLPWNMETGFASAVSAMEAGGADLNFSVAAYASENVRPATADENAIAVITNNTMTSWIIDVNEPDTPAEGMVHISVGTSSPYAFNALKENGVMLYPLKAMQYIGGAWSNVPAFIYQNGAWREWITYLYINGDECVSITGGWIGEGKKYSSASSVSAKTPTITRGETEISAKISSNGASVFYCQNKIDLTGYSAITAIGVFTNGSENRGGISLVAWTSLTNYNSENRAAIATINGESTATDITLDVSALEGEHVIGFIITTETSSYSEAKMSLCVMAR